MVWRKKMKRKTFLTKISLGVGITLFPISRLNAQTNNNTFSLEEIKEFVFAGHNDLDKVKYILDEKPQIINCTNQSKRGDFETAIGGASHVGNKEIADYLVSKGARLDMFNYTFLGYTEFIKKQIIEFPHLLNAPGPHGFTLLHHAIKGGHEVFADWLKSKGLKETYFKGYFG